MSVYNLTFLNNVTSPLEILTGVGTAIDNNYLIGYLILISFFLVFLIVSNKYDFNDVIIIDSFLTTLLAILLYSSVSLTGYSLVPGYIIVWPAIILFISLIFRMINR